MCDLNGPFFSIIITTRDRPYLFKKALTSALQQDFEAFEVIVVNDGSNEPHLQAYQELKDQADGRVIFSELVHRTRGHGHSYAMNHGASIARGQYLCFIDDDDYWVDMSYLRRMYHNIHNESGTVDLYISNQHAYTKSGIKSNNVVWVEDLIDKVGFTPTESKSAYSANVSQLLKSDGFAHLNCLVFRRQFFESIGGMDENLRYEDDRDIYYRAIDQAGSTLYDPVFISHHIIPDQNLRKNLSTITDATEKRLYQLRVYEKGILYSKHRDLARLCRHGKSNQLKVITEDLVRQRKYQDAVPYAWQGLVVRFNMKWLIYSLYLSLLSLISSRARLLGYKTDS